MSELEETKKMKVVQLHIETSKEFLIPTSTPKIAHLGPEKSKMTPKLSQNQMSEFKVTQKMKVVQLHEQTPKQFLNPSTAPKIARQGPKKSKMTPKLSQNQMSELKETKKMKVVQLHEQTPKQFLNPSQPQNSPLGPQKVKNDPEIESKSNVRIEGNIEYESCSTI